MNRFGLAIGVVCLLSGCGGYSYYRAPTFEDQAGDRVSRSVFTAPAAPAQGYGMDLYTPRARPDFPEQYHMLYPNIFGPR
jgi:hypothetical protein